ncbi:MAG TPA: DUF1573 domain-containing protein [Bacteroidales bacterium]|nr:DUF1573 domain-containing protein [Bacteroidales bacterium]
MKKIFFAILLGTTSIWGWAQNVLDSGNAKSSIQFTTTEIDYGSIPQNSNGERVFEFTNTDSKPLILTNVVASCGCTATEWPREPIKPGERGTITVRYNTLTIGPFRKSIRVFTNSNTEPVLLIIKGEVKPSNTESNQTKNQK